MNNRTLRTVDPPPNFFASTEFLGGVLPLKRDKTSHSHLSQSVIVLANIPEMNVRWPKITCLLPYPKFS